MNVTSANCSTIAFYGIQPSAKALGVYYETLIEWFEEYGCLPERIGVHGEGFSGKLVGFSRPHARLKKRGFAGVTSVEIHSRPPAENADAIDGLMNVSIAVSAGKEHCVLSAAESLVSLDAMLERAKTDVKYLKPDYGIGFRMLRSSGPWFYAIGLNYGNHEVYSGPEYEERVRVSRWVRGMKKYVYRNGVLRDVYECNFLTEPQLSRPLDGVSLREWIQRAPERGTLAPFEGDVWLWRVPATSVAALSKYFREQAITYAARL